MMNKDKKKFYTKLNLNFLKIKIENELIIIMKKKKVFLDLFLIN